MPVRSSSIVWDCRREGLHPDLVDALQKVAADYRIRTGLPIRVTSGKRSLRHQARLMAPMTDEQLEGMYCRNGYPSYIRDIVEARRRNGGKISGSETYRLLKNRREGYISSHLSGAAVDISPQGANVPLLKKLLQDAGFRTLDERSLGIDCIHATFKAVPVRIVRE